MMDLMAGRRRVVAQLDGLAVQGMGSICGCRAPLAEGAGYGGWPRDGEQAIVLGDGGRGRRRRNWARQPVGRREGAGSELAEV